MRHLLFRTALFLMLAPVAGHSEVLAVCGNGSGHANVPVSPLAFDPHDTMAAPLALWRDAKGFDLLLNWGEQDQLSLREKGADIIGAEFGEELIHLVVMRPGARDLEHFLFSFDEGARGELVWTAPAAGSPGGGDAETYEMGCSKPG